MSSRIPLLFADWPAPAHVRAAMTTRVGGVSRGAYRSFNLGARGGDDPAAVAENRGILMQELALPSAPAWLHQTHGVAVVGLPCTEREPRADASFTTAPNVVCAVQAADCLPVLFCDVDGTAVAAAHAGWRGLAAGVLEATVHAMPAAPRRLLAWLGPAIGPDAFEVGAEVYEAFTARDPGAADCFRPRARPDPRQNKFLADLYALARRRLTATGVTRIYGGTRCTFSEPQAFFSYRRDGATGRMAALIWLEGSVIPRSESDEESGQIPRYARNDKFKLIHYRNLGCLAPPFAVC